ncbi:MAG: quinolinate synthase NadA [Planctomycetota bacterium]|nr:quinolinate synthase NadA [Planctomycetota bacterium]
MKSEQTLPAAYAEMDPQDISRRIAAHKDKFGRRLCILGHHYQRDAIIRHADFAGDSLKLSQMAAAEKKAQYIVFCGVHFMAESAEILSAPDQTVILPNMRAGCPMAEMAESSDIQAAMDEITMLTTAKVIPLTYVNSTAAAKAVTGRLGGACCTSGNAKQAFSWALDPAAGGADKLLMMPDQHLGRNTALALGYTEDSCAIYDPALPDGGLQAEDIRRATFLLWKGHCYVHQQFNAEHVRAVRADDPKTIVMVHPECPREVVALADKAGSTEQIIQAVRDGKPGSRWAIGTENHLVRRLAHKYPDRTIECLSPQKPQCLQMRQIDPAHLLWSLDCLADGRPVNIVTVADQLADGARLALRRMLDIGS